MSSHFNVETFLEERSLDLPRYGIESAEDLFGALEAGSLVAESLPGKHEEPGRWFYRGQWDGSWGITSGLYRRLAASLGQVVELHLREAEEQILDCMRNEQHLGRRMTDGQLLSVLQHHGVPTRLIDVSSGPLEALFFAVEAEDTTDGRLFLFEAPSAHDSETFEQTDEGDGRRPDGEPVFWAAWNRGMSRASQAWTNRIFVIEDVSLDPRMQAQQGLFLAGGLPKIYAGGEGAVFGRDVDGERVQLSEEDSHRLSNLAFKWRGRKGATPVADYYWGAWSLTIPAAWKPRLRALLAGEPHYIENSRMYPRFQESQRLGVHLAGHFRPTT